MSTKTSQRRKWKHKWWIPTFGQGISTGTDEGLEKRQRSQPSGKSPRRAGMSEQTAKVKTRAKSRHHKNLCGRFWGNYGIGPSCNWAGRRHASAKNAPSTPGRQQTSSAKKTRRDAQGNLADRGRTGKGHHESWHDRDIVGWSQKETEKNRELLHGKGSREVQPAPTQTMWGWDGQGKTWPPYWTQQFPNVILLTFGQSVQWSLQTEEQRRSSTFAPTMRDGGEG